MTDSVGEALLLEGNLIKRFQPRFNVRLKDDKSYPYIKITLADDFPRIERTRKLAERRQPVLRAVRVGVERRRGDEPGPAAVPVPDLHDRHPGTGSGRSSGRACCTTSSAARARASRRSRRPSTAPTSSRSSCSSRAARSRWSGRSATTWRRASERRSTSGRRSLRDKVKRDRADDGEPEDGRVRPDRARPHRRWPARTTRRRSSCS